MIQLRFVDPIGALLVQGSIEQRVIGRAQAGICGRGLFAVDTLTSGDEIARVGNKGYSGSPAADIFECRDGWLAVGANTPAHIAGLVDVLGLAPADVEPLLEPAVDGEPAFARARDPEAFRALIAGRLSGLSANVVEAQLNARGVPGARVRTLGEFTREAVETGLLEPVTHGEGGARAVTPGLGWRVRR